MKIGIHQPNFFHWLGFFNKIAIADKFIIYDTAQLPKKGGSWSNRVKLILSGEQRWVSANLDRDFFQALDALIKAILKLLNLGEKIFIRV